MWLLLTILPFASAQDCETRLPGTIKTQHIMVCGDLEASNFDVEGRIGTLGDANLTNYSAGFDLPDANWTLTIGNALTTANGTLARGIRVGDADASSISGTLTYDSFRTHRKNLEARCGEAQDFSAGLLAVEDDGTATFDGFATLTLEGEGDHSVFTIDSDTLSNSRLVLIDAGRHVLIRVTGDNVSWGNGSIVSIGTNAKRIAWVMDEADELDLYSADWTGTILAANAHTINVRDVAFTGQLVVGDGEATADITSSWFERARLRGDFEVCDDAPVAEVFYAVDFDSVTADCHETCASQLGLACDAEATDALADDHEVCAAALNQAVDDDTFAQDGCAFFESEILETFADRDECLDWLEETVSEAVEAAGAYSAGCITDTAGTGVYLEGLDYGGCDARNSVYETTRVCACSGALAAPE